MSVLVWSDAAREWVVASEKRKSELQVLARQGLAETIGDSRHWFVRVGNSWDRARPTADDQPRVPSWSAGSLDTGAA